MPYNEHSQFHLYRELVAATGNGQSTAAKLATNVINIVTDANGTKGVRLPNKPQGKTCIVQNVSSSALTVYPHVGGDVNDGSTDASVSLAANTLAIFIGVDNVTWGGIYTPAT